MPPAVPGCTENTTAAAVRTNVLIMTTHGQQHDVEEALNQRCEVVLIVLLTQHPAPVSAQRPNDGAPELWVGLAG
eukprot:40351-Eustigmatos_ZCMA.PRE.1